MSTENSLEYYRLQGTIHADVRVFSNVAIFCNKTFINIIAREFNYKLIKVRSIVSDHDAVRILIEKKSTADFRTIP